MKKNRFQLLTTGLTAAALLSVCTMNVFAAQLTEESAKSAALKHAGIKEADTTYIRIKDETDDGRPTYEVKFFTNAYAEYEYEFLKENGTILKIEYDAEAIVTKNNSGKKRDSSISLEKAKETALSHAGEKKENVTFTKLETDKDNGRSVYEIEFDTASYGKYEFKIDASSGIILSWEYELDEDKTKDAASRPSQETASSNSLSSVKSAVLKAAGLKESDVTWGRIHLDHDDGRQIYEGKFFCGQYEYEFEVDAKTLAIADWDIENIYD